MKMPFEGGRKGWWTFDWRGGTTPLCGKEGLGQRGGFEHERLATSRYYEE